METSSHLLDEATLREINDAALLVAREFDLAQVLRRIVEVARKLAHAQYAALGVADKTGELTTFIHSGMAEEIVERMPHLPKGKGLLGALVSERQTIRIPQLGSDARSVGFPDGHPPMHSFLGVPLIAAGEVVGNLYLTNKIDSAEFTPHDVTVVEMLAAHAGLAIARARLYESAEKRNQQLTALNAASMAVAQELALDKVLQHIVNAARQLAKAEYAALGLPNQEGLLDEFIHSGMPSPLVKEIGRLPHGLGLLGAIISEKRSIRLPSIGNDPRASGFPANHPPMDSFLGVPIVAGNEVLGNLYLTNKLDAAQFSAEDQTMIEELALHAAIAIQNARLYEQVEQLAVVNERQRIGMDLHDGVIQSIYAVGLTLDMLKLTLPDEHEANAIVDNAMAGLNHAIQDIRNFIMDLRPRRFQGDLENGLRKLIREFQANTLVPIKADINAKVQHLSPARQRSIFMTVQEALANIARHAKATEVQVSLLDEAEQITLTISDNGRGFDSKDKSMRVGHGLANMRTRARDMGGSFTIESAPGLGTTITLRIPHSS